MGPYTAAAVLSIAYACPLPAVDGNVVRVVTRLTGDDGDPASPAVRGRVRAYVEKSFHRYHPGWVNQAWMELGALVCRPAPECPSCPLAFTCRALREGRTAELPARRARPPLPLRRGAIFLLLPLERAEAGGLRALAAEAWAAQPAPPAFAKLLRAQGLPLLLVRRPSRGLLGGLWELPNVEDSEEEAFRLASHLVPLGAAGPEVRHTYSHFRASYRPLPGLLPGEAVLEGWPEQRWLLQDELASYPRSRLTSKTLGS